MISVLHVCTDFWPSTGGIEQFVLDLSVHTRTRGAHAEVLCLNRVGSSSVKLPEAETVAGVPVRRVPFWNFRFYKPALLPLQRLRAADVVHVHGVGALTDFVLLTKGAHRRPIVVSTHGGIFHTQNLRALKRGYFYGLQPLLLRNADAVVACSMSDERLFAGITKHLHRIDNAVSVERFLAMPMERKRPRRALYVGRLAPNKRVETLLHAFAHVLRRVPDAHLRIVGREVDGGGFALRALAKSLGLADAVTFVGEVSDEWLLAEYQQASVFVSASGYEGFGLSAIEAKAAGCRLVLSDIPAFRSLFEQDRTVALVDFSDPARAGAAWADALSSTCHAHLQSARNEVRVYSWEQKIVEWMSLYDECMRSVVRRGHVTNKLVS